MSRLCIATLILFTTTVCAQIRTEPSMTAAQNKAHVFDLIQRIVKAAEADVLSDEAKGVQVLGFQIRQWVEELTPHAKIPHREITTGIAVLDQEPTKRHVTYAVTDKAWGASVRRIGNLVCIKPAEVEALYGKTSRFYAPLHHNLRGAGTFEYLTETPRGLRSMSFDYITWDTGETCLDAFDASVTQK